MSYESPVTSCGHTMATVGCGLLSVMAEEDKVYQFATVIQHKFQCRCLGKLLVLIFPLK